jgi:NAD-dependent deacetylase
MDERIDELAGEFRAADTAVGFTGAGVSTQSGIPDFRSDDGIWAEHDPETFTIHRLRRDPEGFWAAMLDVHRTAFAGSWDPNPAHRAFADLETGGHIEAIVTQNADRLHQEAGATEVIEVHGNMAEACCLDCSARSEMDDAIDRAEDGELPPTCRSCGGVLKPAGVLFGEQLPEHALFRAHALAEHSDVFIVAGSSLSVEPAASLPETAADRGATLAIVNLEPTPHDDVADYVFREDVTKTLPALVNALERCP